MSGKVEGQGGLMTEVYKDLGQPSARIVGQSLGETLGLVFVPLGKCASIGRNNLMRFVEKLEKAKKENPENIAPAKPSVAVPILEKMIYTDEESLAEAYAELLKNSCLKDQQPKVLPSYATILSNLTPDEVKILDFVNSTGNVYMVPVQDIQGYRNEEERLQLEQIRLSTPSPMPVRFDGIPCLEIQQLAVGDTTPGWIMAEHFNDIDKRVNLSNPENIDVYIENLLRLRIFSIRPHNDSYSRPVAVYKGSIAVYEALENEANRRYKEIINSQREGMILIKRLICLTPLAQSFLAMCTSSEQNQKPNDALPA